jgi:hypothetical protein
MVVFLGQLVFVAIGAAVLQLQLGLINCVQESFYLPLKLSKTTSN